MPKIIPYLYLTILLSITYVNLDKIKVKHNKFKKWCISVDGGCVVYGIAALCVVNVFSFPFWVMG